MGRWCFCPMCRLSQVFAGQEAHESIQARLTVDSKILPGRLELPGQAVLGNGLGSTATRLICSKVPESEEGFKSTDLLS